MYSVHYMLSWKQTIDSLSSLITLILQSQTGHQSGLHQRPLFNVGGCHKYGGRSQNPTLLYWSFILSKVSDLESLPPNKIDQFTPPSNKIDYFMSIVKESRMANIYYIVIRGQYKSLGEYSLITTSNMYQDLRICAMLKS